MDTRPFRSVLYIPGSKERALEKATGLAADAIIFDLEDAVAIDEKARARACWPKRCKAMTMAHAQNSCGSMRCHPIGDMMIWT